MIKTTLKEFFLSLSQEQLEGFGKSLMVTVGSLFSPSWHLMKALILPQLKLQLSAGPVPAMLGLMQHMQGSHVNQLVPALLLCASCSVIFLLGCSTAGKLMTRTLLRRYYPQLALRAV